MKFLLSSCAKMKTETFSDLPAVVLDKIFSKLSNQDLRSIYQVSKSWKNEVIKRPKTNQRREELVAKIRQNKENISKGSKDVEQTLRTDVSRTRTERVNRENSSRKPGSRRIFNDCRNTVLFSSNSSHTSQSNVTTPVNTSTPNSTKSIFQIYEEAKGNLTPGQKLITCKKCYGPVASPISSRQDSSDDVNNRSGMYAPRCDLTSRMSSVGEPAAGHRERKKQRPHSAAHNSSDDLSTSLSKMVITNSSTPEAALSKKMPVKTGNGTTASTPALGIDLPISMNNSSVNCNVSNFDIELTSSTPTIYEGSFRRPNLNVAFSPIFRNDISSSSIKSGDNLSTNLSDSGFSMSYINSDDECNDSHLSISTIQSPEPVKIIIDDQMSSPTNLHRSKDALFGSSDVLCNIAVCSKSSNVQDNLIDIVNPTYTSHNNSSSINFSNSNCTNDFRMPEQYVERSSSNPSHSLKPMLSSCSGYNSKSYSDFNGTESVMRDANSSSLNYSPLPLSNRRDNKICQDIPKINLLNQPFPVQLSDLSSCSENLNESIVVECPNCSFRLCSNCEEKEHKGRRCLIIDSDSIHNSCDAWIVSPINLVSSTGQNKSKNSNSSMGTKGKGSGKDENKKRLRRLLIGK